MRETTIELDLSKHCIETATRRCYNQLLAKYFKAGAERRIIEVQVGMLKEALETFDFSALRAAYSELAGGSQARVVIERPGGSGLILRVDDREIAPI